MAHPIEEVSEIQLGYRGLLADATGKEDPLLEEEALAGALVTYGPDSIANLAMILGRRIYLQEDASIKHLVIAVAILDDLGVLGMEIRHKR